MTVGTDGGTRVGDARAATEDGGAIAALLACAREGMDRVPPQALADEMATGALVVDTRPVEQRRRHGELPGALVIDRNVLEWRLDPTSPHRIPEAVDHDRRVIIVCQEGYSSSLAAAVLRRLGLHRATDLVGGYEAWREAQRDRAELQAIGARCGHHDEPGAGDPR